MGEFTIDGGTSSIYFKGESTMTDVILKAKGYKATYRECGQADKLARHYESIGCKVRVESPNRLVILGNK
jgi:hypothetical protein